MALVNFNFIQQQFYKYIKIFFVSIKKKHEFLISEKHFPFSEFVLIL